jgi:CDP-diglyceride synthetase
MCCFLVSLMFLGPRFAFLIWWLLSPVRVNAALNNFNFPWLVGIAGLVFIPWTILMYTIVFPLNGWDWLWIGLAVACDIFAYTGGTYKRKSIPYYPETAP